MFSSPTDPTTLEGQQVGAILAIKRTPSTGAVKSQVGDIVKVLSHAEVNCKVFNNRQRITETIPWAILLPLPVGTICGCVKGQCRCVKEDPVTNMEYTFALEQQKLKESTQAIAKVVDPDTFEGQQLGAILIIKHIPYRKPAFENYLAEIGDCIKITGAVSRNSSLVKAKNSALESSAIANLPWAQDADVFMSTSRNQWHTQDRTHMAGNR